MPILNFFDFKIQDPQQIEDIVGMCISTVIQLSMFIFPCILFFKYGKPAVRVKQPVLFVLMHVTLMMWLFGNFITYRLMYGINKFFCNLGAIWCFHIGIVGTVNFLILRSVNLSLLKMDLTISSKKSTRIYKFLISLFIGIILFMILIIINIGFTAFGSMDINNQGACVFSFYGLPFRIVWFCAWIFFVFVATFINLCTRGELIESQFLFIGIVLMLLTLVFISIITLFSFHYLRFVRVFLATLPPILFSLYFNVTLLGKHVYNIIICNNKFFDDWYLNFKANALKRMMDVHQLEETLLDNDTVSLASDDEEESIKTRENQENVKRSENFE